MTLKRTVVVVIALVVVVLAGYWVWIAQQETASATYPSRADRTVALSSSIEYADLGQMTASSDLVVRGTVVGVAVGGRWTFAPDSGIPAGGQVDRLLRVRVDETVYARDGVVAPGEIRVLEGIWEAGVGIQSADMPWSRPGDSGYFYLVDYEEYRDDKTFNYVGQTGRVLLSGNDAVVAAHHEKAWEQVASQTPTVSEKTDRTAVESAIATAARQARSGAAAPLFAPEPEPCPPSAQCPTFTR